MKAAGSTTKTVSKKPAAKAANQGKKKKQEDGRDEVGIKSDTMHSITI